jgi:hypothetical protein
MDHVEGIEIRSFFRLRFIFPLPNHTHTGTGTTAVGYASKANGCQKQEFYKQSPVHKYPNRMEHGEQKIPDEFLSIADMYTISKSGECTCQKIHICPDPRLRIEKHQPQLVLPRLMIRGEKKQNICKSQKSESSRSKRGWKFFFKTKTPLYSYPLTFPRPHDAFPLEDIG